MNEWYKMLLDILMVVGPVLGYWPQYQAIKQSGSSESFSFLVSGILLWSNVLRVFFWYAPNLSLMYQRFQPIGSENILNFRFYSKLV